MRVSILIDIFGYQIIPQNHLIMEAGFLIIWS